jgi:hypothetical protein
MGGQCNQGSTDPYYLTHSNSAFWVQSIEPGAFYLAELSKALPNGLSRMLNDMK